MTLESKEGPAVQPLSVYVALFKHPLRYHVVNEIARSNGGLAVHEILEKLQRFQWSRSTIIRGINDLEYAGLIDGRLEAGTPSGRRGGITVFHLADGKEAFLRSMLASVELGSDQRVEYLNALLEVLDQSASTMEEQELLLPAVASSLRDEVLYGCGTCSNMSVYTQHMVKLLGEKGKCPDCGSVVEFIDIAGKEKLVETLVEVYIKRFRWRHVDKRGLRRQLLESCGKKAATSPATSHVIAERKEALARGEFTEEFDDESEEWDEDLHDVLEETWEDE